MRASGNVPHRLPTRATLVALLVVAAVCGAAVWVAAGVFTVTNTDDDGPGSLRDAIAQANAQAGADQVVFDPVVHGQTIYLTSGQLSIADNLVIEGPGEDQLTVTRGPSMRDFRIFEIDDGDDNNHLSVEISGLTISGGSAFSSVDSQPAHGGGLLSREWLVLRNSTISGNTAEALTDYGYSRGGGIYGSGRLVLENATVSMNSAVVTVNYGIAAGGGIYSKGVLEIRDSTISDNTASLTAAANGDAVGGGIFNEGELSIRDSLVADNTAEAVTTDIWYGADANGGGIRGIGPQTVVGCRITGNVASATCHTMWCYADAAGGGMRSVSSMVLILNSTIDGNAAMANGYYEYIFGGGASLLYATIRNSTVSSNVIEPTGAYGPIRGGGVALWQSAVIQNTTFTGNHTPFGRGGGLYLDKTTSRLESSIFHGNTAWRGPDVHSDGFASVNHSLVGDPAESSIPVGVDGNISGDPQLGPLQDNGGPTPTHAIEDDSIAVNAGSNPASLATDQRGYWPRDAGGVTDIGAFERGAIPPLFADDFESGDTTMWSATAP